MGYEPGDKVSGFSLLNANANVGGEEVTFDEILTDTGAVIVFECNHCPYVIGSFDRMDRAAGKAFELGMGFAGINSTDPSS